MNLTAGHVVRARDIAHKRPIEAGTDGEGQAAICRQNPGHLPSLDEPVSVKRQSNYAIRPEGIGNVEITKSSIDGAIKWIRIAGGGITSIETS